MAILFLLWVALQTPAAPTVRAPEPDPFAALREEWAKDLHAKQVADCLAQYAPDADFISDAGRTHGTAALQQLFKTITTTMDSDLTFHSERVEISGDLAYDSGGYSETLTLRATGKAQKLTGDYLTVYRRMKAPNGNAVWLISEQIWTASQPVPGP